MFAASSIATAEGELHGNARRHLRAIHDYIAQDSPTYAKRFVAGILDRSDQLGRFPESGRVVPERQQPDLREIFEPPYRIIDVIAVVHSARRFR